jgi:hypothetical protein
VRNLNALSRLVFKSEEKKRRWEGNQIGKYPAWARRYVCSGAGASWQKSDGVVGTKVLEAFGSAIVRST